MRLGWRVERRIEAPQWPVTGATLRFPAPVPTYPLMPKSNIMDQKDRTVWPVYFLHERG